MIGKIKRKLHESMTKVEDDTLHEIKKEIETYQRPIIISGKVTEACNTLEEWEKGITLRVDDWMKKKKMELNEAEGNLASSVGYNLLNRMGRDTEKYLKSVLK